MKALNKRNLIFGSIFSSAFLFYNFVFRINKFNFDAVDRLLLESRLKGPLSQEDMKLTNYIRTYKLQPPSRLKYNLSEIYLISNIKNSFNYKFIHGILKDLFSEQRNGFFVEAGALDGEYLSNTLWLEQTLGWTGLLVEPDDINFRDLVLKRRKAWISHSCLSSEKFPKEVVMVSTRMFRKPEFKNDKFAFRGATHELGQVLSSNGSKDLVENSDQQYFTSQCYPLYSFLLALNVSLIDFMSLDIQGTDLDVFGTLPFDKITIRALVIEHEGTFNKTFVQYFNDRGFIWLAVGGAPDYFFVNKNETELIEKFGRIPAQVHFDSGVDFTFN